MDFGPFGLSEILLIVVLALVLFGPRQLPMMGRKAAELLTGLRRSTQDLRRALESEVDAANDGTLGEVKGAVDDVRRAGQDMKDAARDLVRLDGRAAPRRDANGGGVNPRPDGD